MRYLLAFMCLAAFALIGCGEKTSSATDADIEMPDGDGALVEAHTTGCKDYTRNVFATGEDTETPDDDNIFSCPEPEVNGDQITVTLADAYLNCCSGPIEQSLHYGKSLFIIRLYADELPGGEDCLCMCHYDVVWTFKVYESGSYTIEVYWGGPSDGASPLETHTVKVSL